MVDKILIGSAAIKSYFKDFNRRSRDIDFAVSDKEKEKDSTKEIEYLFNPVLCQYSKNSVATPTEILSLKVSHLFWNIDWDKHMWDVQFLLDKKVEWDLNLIKDLYSYWNQLYRKRSLNYSQTQEEFFSNQINYQLPHDELHHLLNSSPLYIKVLKHPYSVSVSKKKVEALSTKEQIQLITEELQVMAYERYSNLPFKQAINRMFKHYLIHHAPLYLGLIMIKHFKEIAFNDFNFIDYLNQKVGVI